MYFCRGFGGRRPFDPLDNSRRCSLNKQQQRQHRSWASNPGGSGNGSVRSAQARTALEKRKIGIQSIIDYFARVFVPVVILIFNIFYWGAALRHGGIEV